MTYRDCYIHHLTANGDENLGFLGCAPDHVDWLPSLLDWAKKRNKPIEWIDNYFIRVPASYEEVQQYLDDLGIDRSDVRVRAVVNQLMPGERYLINADEF